MKIGKKSIPWVMAAGRALLGPVLIVGESCNWSGLALASLVITALLSDIFDGVLARRWQCDSAGVRLFDSMADTAFYLCVGLALWLRQPRTWHDNALLLATLLLLEALRFIVEFAKFGKPASYHSYLAKTWGLVMAIAVVATFASSHASRLMPLALVLGVTSNLEGLAMSFILPVWRKDVKTLAAAFRIRRELAGSAARRPHSRGIAIAGGLMSLLMLQFAVSSRAVALEPNHAVYIGGSAGVPSDTPGTLDTSSPAALLFRFAKADGSSGQITIDYSKVRRAYGTNEVTHHLGVAPAIAVGLLAARQRRYFLMLTWTDEAGISQAAQIEIAKRDQNPLLAVILARMPGPCPAMPAPCTRPSAGAIGR